MKINYKTFSKHAERMVKQSNKHLANRPVLQGIHHDDKGTITVTDAHRLYQARNINAPKNTVLHAITGDEIHDYTYPDTSRLLPDPMNAKSIYLDIPVKALITTVKAMQSAGTIATSKAEVQLQLKGNELSLYGIHPVNFTYQLECDHPDEVDLIFNCQYFLDSLEMLKDMNVEHAELSVFGRNRPFTITPQGIYDIIALQLPIRN